MTKQVNVEWMKDVLKDRNNNNAEYQNDLPKIDWIQNNRGFKKALQFKLVGANSKENNIFSWVVATHWMNNLVDGSTQRFICPEQTQHLKHLGVKCPICEAKRKLLAAGFKEEELTIQGKFGPIPMFDPNITSNAKVVVIDSDARNDWDKAHISVLQQKGSFLTKWLAERYIDNDTPDLLEWERSNIIRFSRQIENGRWDREISFATFCPSQDVVVKLKEENEALTMPDLWKRPADKEFLEVQAIIDEKIAALQAAKETMTNGIATALEDDIPF